MEQLPPADDASLTAELGAALREVGSVPEEFLATARSAFAWRDIEPGVALAELTFDSACDTVPALTRSAGSTRTLSFRSTVVTLEIEVTEAGIVGQLSPPRGGRVSAQTASGTYAQVQVDAVGFFSLGAPPPGPVRLRAHTDEYEVATTWVSLR
ncbi:hypothetical protein ACIA5A_23450 [Micromonospora sp. NPDC051300]|uniref:hypothetical protein n=1 Tax=Micromonospora sp. NPDC051300 TaxID=3364286 RepID=UPI00379109D5